MRLFRFLALRAAFLAVSLLGHCTSELRLPMAPIAEASRAKVEAAMKNVGLIGQ